MCGKDKLSCLMPYTFAKFIDVDYLICDEPMPEDFVKALQAADVTLL